MVPYRCALPLVFSLPAGCVVGLPNSTCSLYIQIYFYPGWQVANEIEKHKVSMNSNVSSTDCEKLQPEMEICNRK